MSVKIYRDVPMLPDKLLGRVDNDGKVFSVETGKDEFIGWIDYEAGEVFDTDDELMGWIDDEGIIIGHYEDDDEDIGYVTEEGEIYGYDEEEDIYLGKVTDMEDATEGAAAMLLFFDIFEDEEEA